MLTINISLIKLSIWSQIGPGFREWEENHRLFQYEDYSSIDDCARFRKSPRSGATSPTVGWASTSSARANHSCLMGLVGSILKAAPRMGPESLMEGLGCWERGHSGSQAMWSTHGEETHTRRISKKEDACQNQSLCPWKGLLGKLPDIFPLEGSNLGGHGTVLTALGSASCIRRNQLFVINKTLKRVVNHYGWWAG